MTFKAFIGSGSTGIIGVINLVIIPILITLAFLAFIWGVFQYFFLHGDDATERATGRQFILWGVLGMVVIFSIWGLVGILLSTLGLG